MIKSMASFAAPFPVHLSDTLDLDNPTNLEFPHSDY